MRSIPVFLAVVTVLSACAGKVPTGSRDPVGAPASGVEEAPRDAPEAPQGAPGEDGGPAPDAGLPEASTGDVGAPEPIPGPPVGPIGPTAAACAELCAGQGRCGAQPGGCDCGASCHGGDTCGAGPDGFNQCSFACSADRTDGCITWANATSPPLPTGWGVSDRCNGQPYRIDHGVLELRPITDPDEPLKGCRLYAPPANNPTGASIRCCP